MQSNSDSTPNQGGWWAQRYAAFLTALREDGQLDVLLQTRLPPLQSSKATHVTFQSANKHSTTGEARRDVVADAAPVESVLPGDASLSPTACATVLCVRRLLIDGEAPDVALMQRVLNGIKKGDCNDDDDVDDDNVVKVQPPNDDTNQQQSSLQQQNKELNLFFKSHAGL